ncbi:La-related protein 6 [Phytophthora cinnamomi]|uniref:La-related protein 6 n=1 Tax=Phytophthora cinnamomi TaxID=4785 RepID=UPI00355ACCEA|nr:La-related protein 6 [Phytophthora cinnamomi]
MQLEVAAWVLRHHPALQAALPHLVPLVSDFLGPDPNLSLTKACKLGSTRLLDWLWERSCVSADARPDGWSDPHYYRYQFHEAIEVAAGQGDVSVVTWLMDHFSGCDVSSDAGGRIAAREMTAVDRVELEDNEWGDSAPVMDAKWTGSGNAVRWRGHAMYSAVVSGRMEAAWWLYDNTPHQSNADGVNRAVERAVANGDFEFAEFLLPRGRKIANYVGYLMGPRAAEPMLQRRYLKDNKIAAIGAIWVAAREGNLDLMKRIAAQHPKPPRGKNNEWLQFWGYAMTSTCEGGDVEMIEWMMEHPTGRLLCKQMKEDTVMNSYDGTAAQSR